MNAESLLFHRPAGIGHPYATSPDQRVPVTPEPGERVNLGLSTVPDVVEVTCTLRDRIDEVSGAQGPDLASWISQSAALPEVAPRKDRDLARPDVGSGHLTTFAMIRVRGGHADAAALAGGDGHLAQAQSEQFSDEGAWSVELPPVESGHEYAYQFTATTSSGVTETSGWFDFAPARWQATGGVLTFNGHADVPERTVPELVADSISWLVSSRGVHRVRFGLRLRDSDHVLGFGERFDSLDQRGKSLDAMVFEQYKAQGAHGRTYLPMPFGHVISDQGEPGWGFHVRTSRRTWFDVGVTTPEVLVVEAQVELGERPTLDVALYDGSATEVLHAFLDEVGRAEELPEWVFRLWASGNEWNTQELVSTRMDEHRQYEIPVGAVVIEAWSDEEGITIFRDAQYGVTTDGSAHEAEDFEHPGDGAWPDPKALIDGIHADGVRVLLWQIPLQKTRFDLGDQIADDSQVILDGDAMVRHGHAILEDDGSPYHNRGWWFPQALMPDLSSEEARNWWTQKRRYLVRDLDIDGFKTDGGEHAWGDELRYADGKRGDEANNLNAVHYARAFGDLLRSEGKAPVTFSRAGFTGSQAHGVFWAGDEDSTWEAYESSIRAGVSASACGIVYWGWDLAGFSGPVPDAELYLRSAAAAAFMPIMQYHSEFNHHELPLRDRTPWNVAETTGDPTVIDTFRDLVQIRERLVPYLVDQAKRSVETSVPLMRALCFDFPNDPEIWQHPLQFQLGDALLISPVTKPDAREWSSYLPESSDSSAWIDAWTGSRHTGGKIVSREVPRNIVPVYCRESHWSTLKHVFGQ